VVIIPTRELVSIPGEKRFIQKQGTGADASNQGQNGKEEDNAEQ
jgi:hypothetical protein